MPHIFVRRSHLTGMVLVIVAGALLIQSVFALHVHAQTASAKFAIGTRVQTTAALTVRLAGWGIKIGTQKAGALGTITNGPTTSKGTIWYKVNYDSGVDGWSIQDYLVAVPTTQPSSTASLSLIASTYSVPAGGSTVLTWSSASVTNCIASGGWTGTQTTSGSKTISGIQSPTTYTLTCNGMTATGAANTAVTVAKSVFINVSTVAPAPAPTITLSANPTSIALTSSAPSGSTVLTWSSANAASCLASGNWSGTLATSGTKTISGLNTSQSYTITCTGTGGVATKTVTVAVTPATAVGTFAIGTHIVLTNAVSVRDTVNGSVLNSQFAGAKGVIVDGPQTDINGYVWYKVDYDTGTDGWSVNYMVVDSTYQAPAVAPTLTLTATPATIESGAFTTLAWSSTNATSCVASNGWTGTQTLSGTAGFSNITSSKTYTLTCTGVGGSVTKSATLTVTQPTTTPTPTPTPTPTTGGTVSTPAGLDSALAAAKGGETILLAAGYYGDYSVSSHTYPSMVTIRSADTANPARFRTFTVRDSSNVTVDHINVHNTPNATMMGWFPVVQLYNVTNVNFTNSVVTSDMAINGVPETALGTDSTDNIIGWPTGYAVLLVNTKNVTVQGNDISKTDRGIVLQSGVQFVTIKNNTIHDTRRTAMAGALVTDVTFDGNYVSDIHPWAWGQPYGDHADSLALWMPSTQTTNVTNVQVINNRFYQGSGVNVLGMWFQGNNGTSGFTNSVIRNNVFVINNLQGIILWNTWDSVIDHNVLLRADGIEYKQAPAILLRDQTKRVSVTNNFISQLSDNTGFTGVDANTHSGNIMVQRDSATASGYYPPSLVATVQTMSDVNAVYSLVKSTVTGPLVEARRFLYQLNPITMLAAVGESTSGSLGQMLGIVFSWFER